MILLFWFLILSLALAWGIVGYQQDEIARRAVPPPTPPVSMTLPAVPIEIAVPATTATGNTTSIEDTAPLPLPDAASEESDASARQETATTD